MLFDTTLRRELARTFGATLVVILTIVLTMLLIRTLGQAAGGAVAPQDVVLLLGYIALQQLSTMLALSLFVAIVITIGRLYRDSEMVVWNASGAGLSRFVKPVLRTSWPVLLAVGLLALFVWPWGNRNGIELRDRYEQRSDLSRVTPGVFQTSRDGSRVFFVERGTDASADARNVFVLQNRNGREALTSAKGGRVEGRDDGRWLVLEGGQRNETDTEAGTRTLSRFERYEVLVDERSVQKAQTLPARALPTVDLLRDPTAKNQGELVWRFGLVLAAGNLMLLAIGLGASPPRRTSNWNLVFALLAFVIYYNLINLSQAWVGSRRLGLGSALLLLHGGAFAIALFQLWWRDNATTWRRPGRRAAAA